MGKAKAPEMTPEQRRHAKQVADWLRFEVRRRELTQGEAARRVGVRQGVFGRWHNAEAIPNPRSCDLLADAFGVANDYVLTLAGHRPPDDPEEDPAVALLCAKVRTIDWSVPARLRVLHKELDEMLAFDRERRQADRGSRRPSVGATP